MTRQTKYLRNHCFTCLYAGLIIHSRITICKQKHTYGTHEDTCTHADNTHLNKLVGLLPVQSVGNTEGIRSILLVELAQQLAKAHVDVILTILSFQALWTKKTTVKEMH